MHYGNFDAIVRKTFEVVQGNLYDHDTIWTDLGGGSMSSKVVEVAEYLELQDGRRFDKTEIWLVNEGNPRCKCGCWTLDSDKSTDDYPVVFCPRCKTEYTRNINSPWLKLDNQGRTGNALIDLYRGR